MFWRHFLWNETTRFVQNKVVSFSIHEKTNSKTVTFWTTLCIFFFPDMQRQGKKAFLPLICNVYLSLSLPLIYPKEPRHHPHPLMAYHHDERGKWDKPCGRLWGDCTEVAPATLPMCHDWTGVVALSPPFPPSKY